MSEEAKRLAIIRALLDKAERTTFPEEAKTYSAKAQELMVKWTIDDAMLAGAVVDDGTIGITEVWLVANEFRGPKINLLSYVATNNNCRPVLYPQGYRCETCSQSMWGKNAATATHWSGQECPNPKPKRMLKVAIAGFERDRGFVEAIYTSLLIQAEREFESDDVQLRMAQESMTGNRAGGSHIRWRNAFMLGYAHGIGTRFAQARKMAQEESAGTPGTSMVLASRARIVDSKMGELFGKLGRGNGSSAGRSHGSGYGMGMEAAGRADVGQPRAGAGTKGALR